LISSSLLYGYDDLKILHSRFASKRLVNADGGQDETVSSPIDTTAFVTSSLDLRPWWHTLQTDDLPMPLSLAPEGKVTEFNLWAASVWQDAHPIGALIAAGLSTFPGKLPSAPR
jgi:hypothetical protein